MKEGLTARVASISANTSHTRSFQALPSLSMLAPAHNKGMCRNRFDEFFHFLPFFCSVHSESHSLVRQVLSTLRRHHVRIRNRKPSPQKYTSCTAHSWDLSLLPLIRLAPHMQVFMMIAQPAVSLVVVVVVMFFLFGVFPMLPMRLMLVMVGTARRGPGRAAGGRTGVRRMRSEKEERERRACASACSPGGPTAITVLVLVVFVLVLMVAVVPMATVT